MVLADRKHVQPQLVSELGLLHQLRACAGRAYSAGEIREGGEPEFHADMVISGASRPLKGIDMPPSPTT